MTESNLLAIPNKIKGPQQQWRGDKTSIVFDPEQIKAAILRLDRPCFVLKEGENVGVTNLGTLGESGRPDAAPYNPVPSAFPLTPAQLGNAGFKRDYGLTYAYIAGSMANGISSEQMVIELGKAGCLASFGSGGLIPSRIEKAIQTIQQALPEGPYAFNLIHSPFEQALEKKAVELYLKYQVPVIEASAYINLTPHVVYYRLAGIQRGSENQVTIKNRVIAKVSRREVAEKFMSPAPEAIVNQLLKQGLIISDQAELSRHIPMADDITVEADSGGHTDNRPLVSLFPSIRALRDELQEKFQYESSIRVGAAGGISTPESALAAFMMGAAYVMTGSVNQVCVESGTSNHVKTILSRAGMADVMMAPASDMFEMGVKLQVLKRGTLFPMRGQKLSDIYQAYGSIDEIPPQEKQKLEKQIFRADLDQIWQETVRFFSERDPSQIDKANQNPKKKMALIFRWYLGLSSRWANRGKSGREMDYQIWCGPSMGAFNDWVRGTYLESVQNRKAATIAKQILTGAAYLYRVRLLSSQNVLFPTAFNQYRPEEI